MSSPKTLTATSLRTPAISSLNRSSIGWTNSYTFPGSEPSSCSSSATSLALGLCGSGHARRGFRITNASPSLGGSGSVAASSVPSFENTVATSGNFAIASSMLRCIARDCWRLVPGMRDV